MKRSSGHLRDSATPAGDATFEQLLGLAVAYPSQSAATEHNGRMGLRKNPVAEDVELHAYHLYLQRGASHGHDLDDWLEAERQVLEELKQDKSS